MDDYIYEALPSESSIRLLKFDPDNHDDVLQCSFAIADIASPPEYIALSYVWGDTSELIPISIDGKIIRVTRSLYEALQNNRKTPALLWADALCINQQDDSEKSFQVRMMAKIYQKARLVAVWLGPDEHDDAPALCTDIKALVEFAGYVIDSGGMLSHFDEEKGNMYWQLGSGEKIVSRLPEALVDPDDEEKARLERFFRLPYFTRTWILQEIGLASEVVVLWGDIALQWMLVGLFAMFLYRYCRALLVKLGLFTELERLYYIYIGFSPFNPQATFLHVITNARRFRTTDPKDKVFAMLSHPTAHTISPTTSISNWKFYEPAVFLATHFALDFGDQFFIKTAAEHRNDSNDPMTELPPPLLQADYTKSKEQVYYELAMDHITRTDTIEILATVQHDPTCTDRLPTPSWVPQWDYFVDTPVLGLYTSKDFASSNKKVILAPAPAGEQTLTVRGTLLTRITRHTNLLDSKSFDLALPSTLTDPDSPEVHSLWDTNHIARTWLLYRLHEEDPLGYPVMPHMAFDTAAGPHLMFDQTARSVYSAYMKTWVAGKGLSEVDGFDLKSDFAAYWDRLMWGSKGEPETQSTKLRLPPNERAEYEVKTKRSWQRYRDSAAYVCNKRRFFFTKKGFFGIGPGALREGDFVAVLLGADVPFVIREVLDEDEDSVEERKRMNQPVPMDRKFQLVGECYVQGIMQGQATKGREFNRDITLV